MPIVSVYTVFRLLSIDIVRITGCVVTFVLFYREWPNPVLLKNITPASDNKLGFTVWDPRVMTVYHSISYFIPFDLLTNLMSVYTHI